MSKFGLYNKFTAVEGKRDALADMLLEASRSMEEIKECELYVVSLGDDGSDSIHVYEVWSDENANRASLPMEGA